MGQTLMLCKCLEAQENCEKNRPTTKYTSESRVVAFSCSMKMSLVWDEIIFSETSLAGNPTNYTYCKD